MTGKRDDQVVEYVGRLHETMDNKIVAAIAPLPARIEALEGRRWHDRHVFAPYLDVLLSIRQRLGEGPATTRLATRYNGVIDRMVAADLGSEWSEFRLEANAFYPDSAPRNRAGERVTNTNVSKPVFLMQIEALFSRMGGLMPPEDAKRVGFPTD